MRQEAVDIANAVAVILLTAVDEWKSGAPEHRQGIPVGEQTDEFIVDVEANDDDDEVILLTKSGRIWVLRPYEVAAKPKPEPTGDGKGCCECPLNGERCCGCGKYDCLTPSAQSNRHAKALAAQQLGWDHIET